MFASTTACTVLGSEAVPVVVEVAPHRGLPLLTIIGMRQADAAEARERIRCGMTAIGVDLGLRRIVVSLAPADLPKAGAALDLPIALAILAALEHVPAEEVATIASHGELGLDGSLRAADGVLAAAFAARRSGAREFLVPMESAQRAALAPSEVIPLRSLAEAVAHLTGRRRVAPCARAVLGESQAPCAVDMAEVRAQHVATEAAIIAAAGGHNLLLFGEPGCGKSMLAQRIPTILPDLGSDAALEVATIHDAAGLRDRGLVARPPFRAPHHTMTTQALVGGGGTRPVVGELTLAHRGVLFLDELPEFRPSAVDALRQPLEEREVRIRRAGWVARYPCATQLVAAMNLCRCGRTGAAGADGGGCTCSEASKAAYRSRVSGAIIDRFDMRIRMRLRGSIINAPDGVSSAEAGARVALARARQHARWGGSQLNAELQSMRDVRLDVTSSARRRLDALVQSVAGGGRLQRATMRVARTVADLHGHDRVGDDEIVDAFALCRTMPGTPS